MRGLLHLLFAIAANSAGLAEDGHMEGTGKIEFFGYAGQIDQLNAKIDVLVERQGETVARLAESTDVNRAADTVCWPVAKVRDAIAANRRDTRVGSASTVDRTPS